MMLVYVVFDMLNRNMLALSPFRRVACKKKGGQEEAARHAGARGTGGGQTNQL
jgi:hypothetical protein